MQCKIIKQFNRRGVLQLVGAVIDIPEEMVSAMAEYVRPYVCQARKVGGRICGAPFRIGINSFRSCSDPGCQVPEKRFVGKSENA